MPQMSNLSWINSFIMIFFIYSTLTMTIFYFNLSFNKSNLIEFNYKYFFSFFL